jgi:hypothetical protein
MSNLSVCVRFRPFNAREIRQNPDACCIRRAEDQSFDFKDEGSMKEEDKERDKIFISGMITHESD